jgi:hypothetical protein
MSGPIEAQDSSSYASTFSVLLCANLVALLRAMQIKTALMTWVTRDCNSTQVPLAPFLRNKIAQTLVAVLQVRPKLALTLYSLQCRFHDGQNATQWRCVAASRNTGSVSNCSQTEAVHKNSSTMGSQAIPETFFI